MVCQWLKSSPSLNKGITVINLLDETKFEQFLRRIIAKLKVQDTEIFSEDERQKLEKIFKISEDDLLLSIRTIIYLFRRMLKHIFMPSILKEELSKIGINSEKSECMVKAWSIETKAALNEMDSTTINENGENLNFTWKLNAELSSGYQKKCKMPKAYLTLLGKQSETELELTHPELYSVFLQFESIQNELDNLL
ncbi:uncharacterized protein Vlet [Plodia interpunctella]|uniref:uncharacterized protein Vlet n=1 Tax=Plodia interpunctella TaxID=58824 RepID=UPI0023680018|nr:uncharacterized protein LOC128675930 [Plodia interpunctella]